MNELCKCGHGAESHLRYHGPCQGLMIGGTDMAPNRSCSCGEFENSELSTLRTALACAKVQIKAYQDENNKAWTTVADYAAQIAEKDKEIERLNGIIAEIEALPKEWEGTGYNPNQMARLVNELTKSKQSVFEITLRAEAAESRSRKLEQALRSIASKTCGCHNTSDPNWHSEKCFVYEARRVLEEGSQP